MTKTSDLEEELATRGAKVTWRRFENDLFHIDLDFLEHRIRMRLTLALIQDWNPVDVADLLVDMARTYINLRFPTTR